MRTRLALLFLGTLSMPAFSDEGMWLLNDPPRQRLKEKYGFDLKYSDFIGAYKDNGTSVTSTNGFTTYLVDRGTIGVTFKTTF